MVIHICGIAPEIRHPMSNATASMGMQTLLENTGHNCLVMEHEISAHLAARIPQPGCIRQKEQSGGFNRARRQDVRLGRINRVIGWIASFRWDSNDSGDRVAGSIDVKPNCSSLSP